MPNQLLSVPSELPVQEEGTRRASRRERGRTCSPNLEVRDIFCTPNSIGNLELLHSSEVMSSVSEGRISTFDPPLNAPGPGLASALQISAVRQTHEQKNKTNWRCKKPMNFTDFSADLLVVAK